MTCADRKSLRLLHLAEFALNDPYPDPPAVNGGPACAPERGWICGGCGNPHASEAAMHACAAVDLDALTAAAVAYAASARRAREAARLCWNCGAAPHPTIARLPPTAGPDPDLVRPREDHDMTSQGDTAASGTVLGSDTTVAHPARVYDWLLGGKDNYRADREATAAMVRALPTLPAMVRANRAFLGRAVRHLVTDHRVNQFLDLGCGLPSVNPVHEVAQLIDPASRVVYVDNDPLVLAHCRALLANGQTSGQVEVMPGDVRDPHTLLGHPLLGSTLDDSRPVAVMLVSLLMYFTDDDVQRLIGALTEAMPPGSILTISHPTADFDPVVVDAAVAAAHHRGVTYRPRTRTEVQRLFAGLDLMDPGVVPLLDWRPTIADPDPQRIYYWAGMARIPGHAGAEHGPAPA